MNDKISNEEKIIKLQEWVDENFTPRESINDKFGSYGLKHIAEEYLDFYIPEQLFIDCMLNAGFVAKTRWNGTVEKNDVGDIEVTFNTGRIIERSNYKNIDDLTGLCFNISSKSNAIKLYRDRK